MDAFVIDDVLSLSECNALVKSAEVRAHASMPPTYTVCAWCGRYGWMHWLCLSTTCVLFAEPLCHAAIRYLTTYLSAVLGNTLPYYLTNYLLYWVSCVHRMQG